MTKKRIELPSEATWSTIVNMQEARDVVKANLTEVETDLADARSELNELGAKDETSEEFRIAAARKERCLRVRDFLKDRLNTLSDKIDAAVAKAAKGENELLDVFDRSEFVAKPKAEDLYQLPKPEAPADPRPVGRVGKPGKTRPEAPDPSKGDGVDEHLNASVQELDCRENIKAKLTAAGLTTIGRVVAAIENKKTDLRDVIDVGENIASEIKKAVKAFRARHRKAALEADGAAT